MRRTRIKFCGCRTEHDVEAAVTAGADAIGFIFAPSERRITFASAAKLLALVPPTITPVAVFVAPTREEIARVASLRDDFVLQIPRKREASDGFRMTLRAIETFQIDDRTMPNEIVATLPSNRRTIVLFDTKVHRMAGGTGRTFRWEIVAPFVRRQRSIVAGGLTPENVGKCIALLRPFGVDVSSGIETDGVKDPKKMRRFAAAVRRADAS